MSGTRGFSQGALKQGSLKRRLTPENFAQIIDDTGGGFAPEGTQTRRLKLKGISSTLKINIFVGIISDNVAVPLTAADVPAGAVTMQLTPIALMPDGNPAYGRPVFQDPILASLDNGNHPLPVDCPFGWEITDGTMADEIQIDISLDMEEWIDLELVGNLACIVEAEYNGDWQYPVGAAFALNQLQLVGSGAPVIINTGVDP